MRFSGKQLFRIFIGLLIIGIIAYIYIPHFFFKHGVNAVVSGPIVQIKSPIEGRIMKEPPKPGTEVKTGDVLFSVVNDTMDFSALKALEIETAAMKSQEDSLQKEVSDLEKLKQELVDSDKIYTESTIDRLKVDIERQKSRYRELDAQAEELKRNYNRKESLHKNRNVSSSERDTAKYDYIEATQAAEQARLEISRLEKKLTALESGIFVNIDDRTEVPYQKQRLDEIRIRLGTVQTELAVAKSRREKNEKLLAKEQERVAKLSQAKVTSTKFGVVWDSYAIVGTRFGRYEPVMLMADCTKPFIDVTINQVYYDEILPGHKVKITAIGSDDEFTGVVRAVRGGSIQTRLGDTSGGIAERRGRKEIQVIIDIDEQAIKQTKGDFCHIGRNVKVRFTSEMDPNFDPRLDYKVPHTVSAHDE